MNAGDTGWVLIATALVLFMTPGLALFYGGMVRSKNVLGMLMQNIFAMGILGILWAFVVFSLAFGNAGNGGFDRQSSTSRSCTTWGSVRVLSRSSSPSRSRSSCSARSR